MSTTTLAERPLPTAASRPADLVTAEVVEAVTGALGEIDQLRALPQRVVDVLTAADLFRLYTPVEHGGLELDPASFCAVIEELGRLDASVAWCVWNGNCGFAAPLLEPASAEAVFGRGTAIGNAARVGAEARPVDGGYRVTGRWNLVSGSDHQDWYVLFGIVADEHGPRMTDHGPDLRAFFVRREQASIVDRWHVLGMRGTASNEVVVDDQFVAEELAPAPFAPSRIDRPLYRIPVFTTASCGGAAVALGIARGAIEDLLALAATKTSVRGPAPLTHLAEVQAAVAEHDARVRAASAALRDALHEVYALAAAGQPVGMIERGRVRAAMALAAQTARDATLRMFELGSSSAIYDDAPLNRRMRDCLVATQHMMLQPLWYEEAGRTLCGLEPTLPVL